MAQIEVEIGPELLNIKQAAALLNVSEISLRRWTNSGKLICQRVGGKRERRFRREDLLAFLEQPDQTGVGQTKRIAHIMLEGVAINYGSHLCTVYENDPGRTKLSVPFMVDGLKENGRCYLIAGDEARDDILGHLLASYPQAAAAREQGNLIVLDGKPSGEEMFSFFHEQFTEATRSGLSSIRVVGDMAWFLEKGLGIDELTNFEMRFNQFLAHSYPVISLCQYDARRFSGVGILHALRCHEDTFSLPLSRFLAN